MYPGPEDITSGASSELHGGLWDSIKPLDSNSCDLGKSQI